MKINVGTCHTGSNLISWKCPHPKRCAFYHCRLMHDIYFGCETNSSNIGVTYAEFYTNHHKFMQKPARLVQDGEKKVTFEKKARPTGKKQLRQNDTARTELKRCTRVFEILGSFKILYDLILPVNDGDFCVFYTFSGMLKLSFLQPF